MFTNNFITHKCLVFKSEINDNKHKVFVKKENLKLCSYIRLQKIAKWYTLINLINSLIFAIIIGLLLNRW